MKKSAFLLIALITSQTTLFAQRTRHFADSIRATHQIPELSYAVVTGDKIIEIQVLGKHSINLPDTATLSDRFHLGSNTKALTAFVAAKCVEQGKLQWSSRLFDFFPEWKKDSKSDYQNITLQELLSHRAHIWPFQGFEDPEIPKFTGNKQQQREAFGKFVLTLTPAANDENQEFRYSNAGYTLAALMLEKATGKTWEQLVEKILNKDLKLNVGFSWPENLKHKDTWGHSMENNQLVAEPCTTSYHIDLTEPSGDLNAKLTDYLKFVQKNIQGLQGKDKYLKSETYQRLHDGTPQYAMGWYNSHENGQSFSTHSGTAGTYFTLVSIDRQKNIGYIIFTNAFHEQVPKGVTLLMRKLKANYGK